MGEISLRNFIRAMTSSSLYPHFTQYANDKTYPGEHEAIIDKKTWDKAQEILLIIKERNWLVDKFGERNAVEGKGSVMINNGGITLKGTKGAKARAIFEGTVSTVFHHNDYTCVLVRHDKYISVYCNVENVKVKSGDEIKAGAIIGDVTTDVEDGNPKLLFQLYREKTLLNPADWLKL